ncbi:MAG TPA: D-2-hydroxyacid dehydrogenase [Candidatus Tectomicrobia bacterium]|jgi:phosphoglycerate dehydrogenase-like enzyme
MKILLMPGLTLPEISTDDVARIRAAAGSDAEVIVTTPAEAPKHAADAEVILGPVPRQLLQAAPRLRWVQATSSGVDPFMYPEFCASNVILTSEKGLVGEHLADHAFGLLLTLTRQLATTFRMGPDGWHQRPALRRQMVELSGLTMGIIGFGGTGRAVARRAHAFGMHCQAIDRDAVPPSPEVAEVQRPTFFTKLLETSDVVAICCPLTQETRNLFDDEAFTHMKPGAFLVTVTRGEVIVEDALVRALQARRIRGAALDVAPREPLPPDSALWDMENVVMTPHTAGASQYRAGRNIDRFVRNIEHLRRNEPLEGVIDKQLGY